MFFQNLFRAFKPQESSISASPDSMSIAQKQTAQEQAQVFETTPSMWSRMLHILSTADAVQKQSMLRRMSSEKVHDVDPQLVETLHSLADRPAVDMSRASERTCADINAQASEDFKSQVSKSLIHQDSESLKPQAPANSQQGNTQPPRKKVSFVEPQDYQQYQVFHINSQTAQGTTQTLLNSSHDPLHNSVHESLHNPSHSPLHSKAPLQTETTAWQSDLVSQDVATENKVDDTRVSAAENSFSEWSVAAILSQDFLNAAYLRHLILRQPHTNAVYSVEKLQKVVQTEQNNLGFCNGELYADDEHLAADELTQGELSGLIRYKNKLENVMRQTYACSVVENNLAQDALIKIAIDKATILQQLYYLESSGLLFKILNESVDGRQVILINVRPRSFALFINQYRAWRDLHPSLSKQKKAEAAKKQAKNKAKSKSTSRNSKAKTKSAGRNAKSKSTK